MKHPLRSCFEHNPLVLLNLYKRETVFLQQSFFVEKERFLKINCKKIKHFLSMLLTYLHI